MNSTCKDLMFPESVEIAHEGKDNDEIHWHHTLLIVITNKKECNFCFMNFMR